MPSKRLSPYKWRKRKKECFERDEYTCQDCGDGSFRNMIDLIDAHHIIFRSKGGSDELENLVTLCHNCHHKRHPEKQTRWTPGLAKLREEAIEEFNKIYPPELFK